MSGRQKQEEGHARDRASREPASPADACRRALAGGSTVRLRVEGSSMAPEVMDGDLVEAMALGGRPPEPGEVVLLGLDRGPVVVHRVVARRTRGHDWLAVTCGDATGRLDRVLGASSILGRVTAIRRAGETRLPHPIPPGAATRLRAVWRLSIHGRFAPDHLVCVLARRTARALGWLRRALRLRTSDAANNAAHTSATLCAADNPAATDDCSG